MGECDHLNIKGTNGEARAQIHDLQRNNIVQPCFDKFCHHQFSGEGGRVNWTAQPGPQVGYCANMIFMGVGEDDGQQIIAIFFDERRVRHDDINARCAAI